MLDKKPEEDGDRDKRTGIKTETCGNKNRELAESLEGSEKSTENWYGYGFEFNGLIDPSSSSTSHWLNSWV